MVLSHGLEGNSQRHYILRPAKFFSDKEWDILAWNNRSCSGEMNRLPRFYHHGTTEDLAAVIDKALTLDYDELILVGFSMGGGMQQKYLGERETDNRIKGAISFSVPCNVLSSADELAKKENRFYERRFISKLRKKVLEKADLMELPVNSDEIRRVKTFKEFDKAFTLKIHTEYKDSDDFYRKITSDRFLSYIKIPLLIVNAGNDPMLGEACYPYELARASQNIYLEVPEKGGHLGYTLPNRKEYSYMEFRIENFLDEIVFPIVSSSKSKDQSPE